MSLLSFENEEFIFPAVHHATKFCLLTLSSPRTRSVQPDFLFFARRIEDLKQPERHFTLSAEEISLLNPNTMTCPIFRSIYDAELTKAVYLRLPVLQNDHNPDNGDSWSFDGMLMFMTNVDTQLLLTAELLAERNGHWKGNRLVVGSDLYLPFYEAKMIFQYDHRFGTYEGQTTAQANQGKLPELSEEEHANPYVLPQPRYWVNAAEVENRIGSKWGRNWLLGWRDITSSVTTRTAIATILPKSACPGELTLFFTIQSPQLTSCLLADWNSIVHDYVARQKIGGTHLKTFSVRQLPHLPPEAYDCACKWCSTSTFCDWLFVRVLELSYTSWDLEAFAIDCGWTGSPFRWDDNRRFLIRCELDAAFFHLYLSAAEAGQWKPALIADGTLCDETTKELAELTKHFPTPRHAVAYIMETFPIVKRKDEKEYGCYRTKETILSIYDEMAESMKSGKPYQTRLDPPPGPPTNADGTFATLPAWPAGAPKPANWPPHIHEPRRNGK